MKQEHPYFTLFLLLFFIFYSFEFFTNLNFSFFTNFSFFYDQKIKVQFSTKYSNSEQSSFLMTCIHDDDDFFFLLLNFNQFCVSEIAIKIGIADAIIFCKSIQKIFL